MDPNDSPKLSQSEIKDRLFFLPTDRHLALDRLEKVRRKENHFAHFSGSNVLNKNLPSHVEEKLLEKLAKELNNKYGLSSSNNEEVNLALIESAYLLGDLESASKHIYSRLQTNPSDPFGIYYQASVDRVYERNKSTITSFLKLLEMTKDQPLWQVLLLGNLGDLSYLEQNFISAQDYYNQAKSLCIEHTFTSYLADIYYGQGILFEWLHDVKKAEEQYKRSLEIDQSLEKKYAIISVYRSLGKLFCDAREYQKAKDPLSSALDLAIELDDKPTIALCLISFNDYYSLQQDWASAIDVTEKVIELLKQFGDSKQLMPQYFSLGNHYRLIGNLEQFETCFLSLLEIAQAEYDNYHVILASSFLHQHYLSVTKPVVASKYQYLEEDTLRHVKVEVNSIDELLNIAFYYDINGQSMIAEELFNRALNLSIQSNRLREQAHVLSELASVLENLGKIDECKIAYRESKDTYENLGLELETVKASNNIAHLMLAQGDLEEAEETYLDVLSREEKIGHRYGVASTCCDLGHLYLMLDRKELADDYFERAKIEFNAIGQNVLASQIDDVYEDLARGA